MPDMSATATGIAGVAVHSGSENERRTSIRSFSVRVHTLSPPAHSTSKATKTRLRKGYCRGQNTWPCEQLQFILALRSTYTTDIPCILRAHQLAVHHCVGGNSRSNEWRLKHELPSIDEICTPPQPRSFSCCGSGAGGLVLVYYNGHVPHAIALPRNTEVVCWYVPHCKGLALGRQLQHR
eukprot:Opistho-2@17429